MIRVYNIEWDTDGEYIPELPTEVELDDYIDGEYIEDDDVADVLSDMYGWCIFNLEIERDNQYQY